MAKVHHSAIVTRDVEASLVFWRDGLGLAVHMDEVRVELMDTAARSGLDSLTGGAA